MKGFGNFDSLMKGVTIANSVSPDSLCESAQGMYEPSKPMFPHLRPQTRPLHESHNGGAAPDADLDALLGSITNDMGDIFTESTGNKSPINQPSAIDTPKPRPAVSQTEFVNAAIKAKSVAEVDKNKQKIQEQHKADLIKMTEASNSKLVAKGNEFKKFLVENIATEDNVHLIEAVSKIFDLIVLESK